MPKGRCREDRAAAPFLYIEATRWTAVRQERNRGAEDVQSDFPESPYQRLQRQACCRSRRRTHSLQCFGCTHAPIKFVAHSGFVEPFKHGPPCENTADEQRANPAFFLYFPAGHVIIIAKQLFEPEVGLRRICFCPLVRTCYNNCKAII
jgi:hypothetical protein